MRWVLAPATLIERSRGRRRILLVMVYTLVASIVGCFLWRASTLFGLPDIGDPFDMKEFLAFQLPDDRNAYTFYQQANDKLKDAGKAGGVDLRSFGSVDWAKATEAQRAWVLENREALELWRQGTERPDAMALSPRQIAKGELNPFFNQFRLWLLARLEASRLEKENDMAGAWRWHYALVRAIRHEGMHGTAFQRTNQASLEAQVAAGIARWAGDPRVNAKLLETAVRDALEADTLEGSDAFTLKVEYIDAMRVLDDPARILSFEEQPGEGPIAKFWLFGQEHSYPGVARRFFEGEPEVCRRVVRLTYANWLAHEADPNAKPVLRILIPPDASDYSSSWTIELYGGANFPANARALAPGALAQKILKSRDARNLLLTVAATRASWPRAASRRGDLAYRLAEEWYRREHDGAMPKQPEALLGRYLKELPVAAELPPSEGDETVPTVTGVER